MAYILQNMQNLVIAEDGCEMYKDLKHRCTVIVLLIEPFVWWLFHCRCHHGLLKFSIIFMIIHVSGTGTHSHLMMRRTIT